VLRKIEERATETAHRMLWTCGAVFRYAIVTGRLETDITPSLKGSLKPVNGGHFSAITDTKVLGALLRAIDSYSGSLMVKTALQIAPLVFVRPIELRNMEWTHVDFDTKEWRYLVTKTNAQHIVPLANQVINAIQELQPNYRTWSFCVPQ
jgi:integrase